MGITEAVIGAAVGLYTSKKQADAQERAASKAEDIQSQAANDSISEQRRQFDSMQELLAPFVEAGSPALQQLAGYSDIGPQAISQQKDLAGLNGYDAQQAAISNIERSPLYQAQVREGEEALLQNAAATGGLRGGNTQAALAQFRPQMLNQAIENQYSKLGGLSNFGAQASQNLASIGQASATRQAAAGMQLADSVGSQMRGIGSNRAQLELLAGKNEANMIGNISRAIGKGFGAYDPKASFGQNLGAMF